MARWGGRWTRVALRLGLLLGGVLAAWGVHEAAATPAAHAADRPPAAPVDAAVDLLTGVLRPILSTTAPPAPEGLTDHTAPGIPPSAADRQPAADRPPARPANQVTSPPPRPVQVATPKPAAVNRPAIRAGDGEVLAPVGDVLRPVMEPVRAGVFTPVSEVLRPVAAPVRAGVLAPVAHSLSPVTQSLAPILSPVMRELEPVLEPLDPVLEILDPVTDVLDPPIGPSATSSPAPTPIGTVGVLVADAGSVGEPAGPVAGPGLASTSTGRHTAYPRHHVGSDGRYPFQPDAGSMPAMPAPGTSGSGLSGTAHGGPADAPLSVWTPPSLAGRCCHPTGEDALPSRSPRPGTRPA